MSLSNRMRLVFRLGGIGFTLPVDDLIELREGSRSWIDTATADPDRHLLGSLAHRGRPIPVLDLRPGIGLAAFPLPEKVTILIVGLQERPLALPVDRMEGIFPAAEFASQELPALLRRPGQSFDTLDVWREETLVHGELKRLVPPGAMG